MTMRHLGLALTFTALVACGREGESRSRTTNDGHLAVVLDTTRGIEHATVVLTGLRPDELAALRANRTAAERLLRVSVSGESIALAGRWEVTGAEFEFRPAYTFDRGRAYSVRVDPAQLAPGRTASVIDTVLRLPEHGPMAITQVVRLLPSADVVPENLLRLYVEFTAPMSREGAIGRVHLLDDAGREVPDAFLPLEADFWNADRTRYTLFLDPGRVKRGIMPNEQLGRALTAGRGYTLLVDSTWRDANGRPLGAAIRQPLRVSEADVRPLSLDRWRISAPAGGTRDPLVVVFDRSMDHGLVRRALGVEDGRGRAVVGETTIGQGETEWRFVPREPWHRGPHALVVLSIVEDPAGNRIGRPFEVDMFERVDSVSTPERHKVPFVVR
jgi:hypothetical protein